MPFLWVLVIIMIAVIMVIMMIAVSHMLISSFPQSHNYPVFVWQGP